MPSESLRKLPDMSHEIRENVNSQLSFHVLYFSQYCSFAYTKRRIQFQNVYISASETNESGTQKSIAYLRYTFSGVRCVGVIRFRGCK